MKKRYGLILCLLALMQLGAQKNTHSQKLDGMITKGMQDWKIPGLAAIVVKDGQVVFQKTYGVKNLETMAPVDENTLFNMGSTTKALVAISLAMLVDEGKLNWDEKVVDHLPYFKLADAYITADARVKDLLTHNLGMGNTDWLWIIDSASTRETLRRFQFAKPAYPLRGGFTYQNIMYAVAGELIEAVSGKPWNEFVRDRIFIPLGMTRTQALAMDIFKVGNYVTPYANDPEDGMVAVEYGFSDQIGAAGMVCSTAKDIGKYLQFLVNGGIVNNDTLIRPATFDELFKPQVLQSESGYYPTTALTKPNWNTYGLGWFQQDYKGHKLDFHTGSLFGLCAIAGIMHDKNMAVYVFANLDHAELRHAIMLKAVDLFAFDDNNRDWHAEIFNLYKGLQETNMAQLNKKVAERVNDTRTSLPLEDYTGIYHSAMLGTAKVSVVNGALKINFNDFIAYPLEHWHYDTFVTDKDPRILQKFDIRFELNNGGKVAGLDFMGEKFVAEE